MPDVAPPKGWTRTRLQASRDLWSRRERFRYARWQAARRATKPGNALRARWFRLYEQAHVERVLRERQLAAIDDGSPFVLGDDEVNAIIDREGIYGYVYNDSQGHATTLVGRLLHYGNYTAADAKRWGTKAHPRFTRQEAIGLFRTQDLPPQVAHVKALWAGAKTRATRARVGACVSLQYNVGDGGFAHSTVLARIRSGASVSEIVAAFMMWDQPPEIRSRRRGEARQFTMEHGPYPARVD